MQTKLALIALGGALGSVLRYLVQGWVQPQARIFPYGTLAVNVSGCLVFGLLYALTTGRFLVPENIRIGLLVGVMGGYTTFSSYAFESFQLGADRQWQSLLGNLLLSNGLGLVAAWIGVRAGQRFFGV